jgi:uncharacterized protein (DUF433 family)
VIPVVSAGFWHTNGTTIPGELRITSVLRFVAAASEPVLGSRPRRAVGGGVGCWWRFGAISGTQRVVSAGVARIIIAEVVADDAIKQKIRGKHPPLTFEMVRQALIYARDVQAVWVEDEEHGRRVMAEGKTYGNTRFVAYMDPVNEHDPDEGTWRLRTAIPEPG